MLWDIIRDFIVEHITGGYNSAGTGYITTIGTLFNAENETSGIGTNVNTFIEVTNFYNLDEGGYFSYMTLGDWLATTITAVIMILLVVFAVWLVRWIFKAVSSAFLLK